MNLAEKQPPSELDQLPVVEPLDGMIDAVEAFYHLSRQRHCLFFDSARRDGEVGRYSFVLCNPFDWIVADEKSVDPLAELKAKIAPFRTLPVEGLPPFQGGAAGLIGYELGSGLEGVAPPAWNEFQVPRLAAGLYDVLCAFDHQQNRGWIVSQGFPETDLQARRQRALSRAAEMRSWLQDRHWEKTGGSDSGQENEIPLDQLAPQHETSVANVTSDFSRDEYLRSAQRVIDYIYAGDVFQVNLSQRLLHRAVDDSRSLYLRLRERNAAPFAGYFDLGEVQICSASPERFLSVFHREVEARPIKGTRARILRPEADLYAAQELRACEKDRAENIMIADLMRNDLSRVCSADSVHVTKLCGLESYEYVQHLVSVIRGTMREENSCIDLLKAAFPGGSITGAPKVRAMEIIAELEPTVRGPYCGSLGYLGFDGSFDTSILIRTITASRGWWQLPVGGGIVAQSDPVREYDETWHKAEGLLRSLV